MHEEMLQDLVATATLVSEHEDGWWFRLEPRPEYPPKEYPIGVLFKVRNEGRRWVLLEHTTYNA